MDMNISLNDLEALVKRLRAATDKKFSGIADIRDMVQVSMTEADGVPAIRMTCTDGYKLASLSMRPHPQGRSYPNWEKAIPAGEPAGTVRVNRADILAVIKANKSEHVTLTAGWQEPPTNTLSMSFDTMGMTLPAEITGRPADVKLDRGFLERALASMTAPWVELATWAPEQAVRVTPHGVTLEGKREPVAPDMPAGQPGDITLIMPIRR